MTNTVAHDASIAEYASKPGLSSDPATSSREKGNGRIRRSPPDNGSAG